MSDQNQPAYSVQKAGSGPGMNIVRSSDHLVVAMFLPGTDADAEAVKKILEGAR
jgi:HSP20 family molecular chaperone IbpA